MNVVKTVLASAIAIWISGCVSVPGYVAEDKRQSMLPHSERRLKTFTHVENRQGALLTLTNDVRGYLGQFTARIVSAEEIDKGNIVARSDTERSIGETGETVTNTSYSVEYKDLPVRGIGQAVIVANDGYFLTAAHVLVKSEQLLVYSVLDVDTYEKESLVLPIRVVFVDGEKDFAIIKAPLSSPIYPYVRDAPLREGELLFAGGWENVGPASGYFLCELDDEASDEQKREAKQYAATIPVVDGDSGSGVFDEEGTLCGVVVGSKIRAYYSLFGKRVERYARFSMVDAQILKELVDADRHAAEPANRAISQQDAP